MTDRKLHRLVFWYAFFVCKTGAKQRFDWLIFTCSIPLHSMIRNRDLAYTCRYVFGISKPIIFLGHLIINFVLLYNNMSDPKFCYLHCQFYHNNKENNILICYVPVHCIVIYFLIKSRINQIDVFLLSKVDPIFMFAFKQFLSRLFVISNNLFKNLIKFIVASKFTALMIYFHLL